jgi:hypothetical protein
MSVPRNVNVSCLACGKSQDTRIWASINVDLDATLRSQLLDGKLNVFHCESCGHEAFIAVPLLYHDMKRRFCVQFLPEQVLDDPEELAEYSDDGRLRSEQIPGPIVEQCRYLTEPHVVFDINEAIRYIRFREILHNRAGTRE